MPACFLNLTGVHPNHGLTLMGSQAPADSEFFYVDLDIDAYESNDEDYPEYEIGTTKNYGDAFSRDSVSNCEIEYIPQEEGEERNSTETIICILDVAEFEFAVKDFHIVYNFPSGMCEYTAIGLPWHFNYPIHPGPVVEKCSFETKGDSDERLCDISRSNESCPAESASIPAFCKEKEDDLCPRESGEEPLCCAGGKSTQENEDGNYAWLPDRDCFGGPGTIAPQFPVFQNIYIETLPESGLRKTISLDYFLSFNNEDNSTASYANYLKALDAPPEDLPLRENELPVFLQNSPYYDYSPREFFIFQCLDGAREVVHEILLMIREWNTMEELEAFVESKGKNERLDPDVEGREGRDCDHEERGITGGGACNDEYDLEDYSDYPRIEYQGDNNNDE